MGKPYAKVDVALRDHPKAIACGPAGMGVWLAALCYIRDHLTDGFVPREVVPGLFGGGAANFKAVAKLVEQGLFVEAPGGFVLTNYAQKNQTKEQVTTAIDGARERMRRVREIKRCSPDVRANIERTNAFVPPSPSPSDQSLDPDPDLTRGADPSPALVEVVPGNAVNDVGAVSPETPPPDWFAAACAAVELTTGEKLRTPECWLRYAGHRAGKPDKRAGPADARYWLTTVIVAEQRRDRERASRIPNAGTRSPVEPAPAPFHAEWRPPRADAPAVRGEAALNLAAVAMAALGAEGKP